MKNLLLCILLVSMAAVIGCSKDDTTTNPNTSGGTASDYYPTTTGTWWKYTTPTDTAHRSVGPSMSFNGRTYLGIIEENSFGTDTTFSFRSEGSSLYTVAPKDSVSFQEVTFLNTTVGATWSYNFTISIFLFDVTTTVSGKTIESGLTRTVNGKTYNDVLHIQITTTAAGSPSNTVDVYFAKGIGEIEVVDPTGESSESLLEYQIK